MKKSIIILLVLVLTVHLNFFSQTIDSVVVSISEVKNANKTHEQLKDCQSLLLDKDTIITDLKQEIDYKDEKIGDLYNVIDLSKDNLNLCNENRELTEAEIKLLKKQIRREKIKLLIVVGSAVIVQVITFKALYL